MPATFLLHSIQRTIKVNGKMVHKRYRYPNIQNVMCHKAVLHRQTHTPYA